MLFDINQNVVYTDICTADELMLEVIRGRKLMQLICSIGGLGKTARAKKWARQHGIVLEKDSDRPGVIRRGGRFVEDRPKQAISLVRTLWCCHQREIDLLLLDDPGKLASDEDCCDILKLGFWGNRTVIFRTPEISRNAGFKRDKPERYDPTIPDERFVLALLRMLWLSNTNFTDPAVLARLGDHFAPLIARGLNPFWIRDDREHDNHDLFLYTWWLATEDKLLRGLGFPYRISKPAVNFYVAHSTDLVDLSPRGLEMIAHAMANPIPRARDAALISMLNKRGPIRPGLKLPAAWVTVIDGVSHGELVWPDTPPRAQTRPETPSQKLEPEPDTDQPTPEPSRTPQRPILTPEEFAVGAQQALAGEREAHRTLTKPLPRTGRLARVKTLIIELLKLPPRYSAEYGPAIAFINAMQKDNEGFAAADTLESYLKTANVVAAVTPDPTVIFGKG